MGYNLPDNVSQSQIDRLLGGDFAEFQCGDIVCLTLWGKMPETFPCDFPGCTVVGCGDCWAACYSCSMHLCSKHRKKADLGFGRQFSCDSCVALDAAQERGAA